MGTKGSNPFLSDVNNLAMRVWKHVMVRMPHVRWNWRVFFVIMDRVTKQAKLFPREIP